MNTKEAISGLKKKMWLRLSNFSIFAIAFLLVDEFIKEGYLFKVSDVLEIGTHENLISIFALVGVISYIIYKKGEVGNEGRNNS